MMISKNQTCPKNLSKKLVQKIDILLQIIILLLVITT